MIFGFNLDKSGVDARDFNGAAGHGGRTHHGVSGAIVKGDVTTEPQLRHASEAAKHMVRRDMTMDIKVTTPTESAGSHARGRTIGGNALTAAVQTAGLTGNIRVGALHHSVAGRGDVRRTMVSEVPFDALKGEASQVVRELVQRNPKFDDSAGLTAHRFIAREDGERGQGGAQKRCQIKAPKPLERLPRPEMTAAQKVEYGELYGSQVAKLILGQPEDELYSEVFQANWKAPSEQAGLTSTKLALKNPELVRSAGDHVPDLGPPEQLLEGSAGQRGSTQINLAASRKGGVKSFGDHAMQVIQQDRSAPPSAPITSHIDRNQRTYSNARTGAATHDNLAGYASEDQQKFLLDNRIHGPPKVTAIPGRAGTQRNRTPAAYADQFDEVSCRHSNPPTSPLSFPVGLTPRPASGCLRAQHGLRGGRLEKQPAEDEASRQRRCGRKLSEAGARGGVATD